MQQISNLHQAQVSVLRTLRHTNGARYSELRRPTGLESDVFKFHIRKLAHQKLIEKLESGEYILTAQGKEFANSLSKSESTVQKQPKLSVAIIASKSTARGPIYVFQKRLRNPFYGFWGCITGPVQWGESIEETAKREFEKQTGLTASYRICSFYRKRDYDKSAGTLLEDKLFAVIEATKVEGKISNKWPGGFNTWLSLEELESQEKYFSSSRLLSEITRSEQKYGSEEAFYNKDDY